MHTAHCLWYILLGNPAIVLSTWSMVGIPENVKGTYTTYPCAAQTWSMKRLRLWVIRVLPVPINCSWCIIILSNGMEKNVGS
ncbi:hypothetical protein DFH27DRAFT_561616 [Peziza echinospora]|nr:hypothetical protein DFH27DRAFT_561616 [Peziza echinospora]